MNTLGPRDALINLISYNENGETLISNMNEAICVEDITMNNNTKNIFTPLYTSTLVSESSQGPIFTGILPQEEEVDKKQEHLVANSQLFNNIFYQPNFTSFMKILTESKYDFVNFFYPSFTGYSFHEHIVSCLGGIYPETTTRELEDLEMELPYLYNASINWFHTNADDMTHVKYCLELYDVVSRIIQEHISYLSQLSEHEVSILKEWSSKIKTHHRKLQSVDEYSDEYFKICQKLYDMLWNPLDNPFDGVTCAANAYLFIQSIDDMMINEESIINRKELERYIIEEMELPDTAYLLPGSFQFPILNKDSVALAMSYINNVDDNDIGEYTENLNKKYMEYGCTFRIPANHPYAKYAITGKYAIPQAISHLIII